MDAETPILTTNKDFVRAEGDEPAAPPVHPYLVEYLREKFPVELNRPKSGEDALAQAYQQIGRQEVINFLAQLVKGTSA